MNEITLTRTQFQESIEAGINQAKGLGLRSTERDALRKIGREATVSVCAASHSGDAECPLSTVGMWDKMARAEANDRIARVGVAFYRGFDKAAIRLAEIDGAPPLYGIIVKVTD
jgi:hypothetical protein